MTSAAHRDTVISPGRYRRRTVGLVYSTQNTQSVPNSARLSSTPRSSSALDRRWVHRSQGDLTLDMDVHPRLQSEFYQELYQKYPHAFRRRRESREAGRKLFNSRLHVRFKDDAEFCDENHVSSGSLGNLHSNTHLTNWDREVGHYMKHKSRSRECITSVEPSECSGSVLSVTQRLRLNTQSLNKLLNSDSPLRKHFDREHVQYDSGTENEHSLQDYLLEKSKERNKHRKKQHRIIIQRNVSKKGSVDKEINKENEYNSRRWISKSVSPTRRQLIEYSLPNTNNKYKGYQVNVESLIANSDLKIDTLLGKISAKMSSPESPPDSAIDVDTPSVQSLVGTDTKGGNSGKSDSDLPVLNGQETGSFDSQHEHSESSPGSSASANASKQCAKTSNDDIVQNPASNESLETGCDGGNEDVLSVEVTTAETKPDEILSKEEEEMNKIVEKYESSENLCQSEKPDGLLQLYTEDMGYNNVDSSETAEKLSDSVENQDVPDGNHDDIKNGITKETAIEIPTSCAANTQETSVEVRNAEAVNVQQGHRDEDISTGELDIREESVNKDQKVDHEEDQIQEASSDVLLGQEGSINEQQQQDANADEDQEQEVDSSEDQKGDVNTSEQHKQEAVTEEDQKLEADITENKQKAFTANDQKESVDISEDQKQEDDDTEDKEEVVVANDQKLEGDRCEDSEKETVENKKEEAVIDEDHNNKTDIDEQKKHSADEQQIQVSEINEQQNQASDINEQENQTTEIDKYQEKGTEEYPEQITDTGQCQKQITDIDKCQEQITDIDKCQEQITYIDECQEQITDIDDIPKLETDIDNCPRGSYSEENVDYNADDEQEAEIVAMEIAQNTETVSKRMTVHRESDVDSGIGYSSAGTDMLPPRGRVTQRETNKKSQPLKAKHDILPLKSEVDVDILDEVNLVHLSRDLMKTYDSCARRGSSAREEKDDTDVRLGVTKPSEKDKKLAEKYRRTRSPSPYILRNRQPSPGFRPESAPSFAQGETNVNLRVVDIPLGDEVPESIQSAVHNEKTSVYQEGRAAIKSKASSKSNSCQNSDISKFSSMPNLPDNMSKHSNIYSANTMSSKLIRQRQCSVTSGSSISLLSESETDGMLRSSNASYVIDDYPSTPEGVVDDNYERDMEEERFSEIELDSGTNIENLAERKPSELVRMIRGMNQPGTTSPRVKEKRLKIRNILKNRKGSYNPPDESGKHPDEKNIVNRIYAKVRGAVTGGSESVDKSGDHSEQKSVDKNNADESFMTLKADTDKNGNQNNAGIKVPSESAISADKDTESVNQFISGASGETVTAKPVFVSKAENDSETIETNVLGDMDGETLASQDEIIGQSERSVSPTKALPPKKPARNKNKNKNLNALAGQLNFSKYKIRVDEGLPTGQPISWNAGKETDQSDQSPESQDLPACDSIDEQSPTSPTVGQQPKLGKGSSHDTNSEIEEWQPLKSTTENNGNTTQKKRGSKGMFKFFKKSVSMDRGIETVGMDPNPTGQSSQESKEKSPPKAKKSPSLKSFTSIFSRKKKKKGQFIIDDVENASKRSSVSSNEQGLPNGKQQHYASCHSLETVGSSVQNQPVRQHSRDTVSSHQEFQPIGRLIKVNPDGTQVIQLYKPENGPIGFFIAKGNPKCGNGIFVSRFVETRPEQCFAGLLGIGDEIIEVNGHLVRDFSQDAVYSLISASAVVLVKVLPFIARKDV